MRGTSQTREILFRDLRSDDMGGSTLHKFTKLNTYDCAHLCMLVFNK